jgi:hypothetical protein
MSKYSFSTLGPNMKKHNPSRQPTPGDRSRSRSTPLARRGCALRSTILLLVMKPTLLALLLTVTAVRANEDLPVDWHSIAIGFGNAKFKDSVRIGIRGEQLSDVSVHWHAKPLHVPVTEFSAAPKPRIKTIDILQGELSSLPLLIVEMRYGSPLYGGEYPRAHFLFYSGRYQRMSLRKRIAKNQWEHSEKLPSKPPTIEGIETDLGEVGTTLDVSK